MNKIEQIFSDNKKPSSFARSYLSYLKEVIDKVDEKEIEVLIDSLLEARENGRTVYFIGNGGSAATASHFANDLQIGTRSQGKPFKVLSLTDNVPVLTAIGNDFGYEDIFFKQLQALLTPNDLVVAISASGNSPNVIKGIEYAQNLGCKTFGITGFTGGKLKEMTTHSLHVPTDKGEYGPVEDLHMIFDHVIGNYLMLYCRENNG